MFSLPLDPFDARAPTDVGLAAGEIPVAAAFKIMQDPVDSTNAFMQVGYKMYKVKKTANAEFSSNDVVT